MLKKLTRIDNIIDTNCLKKKCKVLGVKCKGEGVCDFALTRNIKTTTITMVYKRDLDEIKRVKKNGHLDNLTTNIKNSHPYVREV